MWNLCASMHACMCVVFVWEFLFDSTSCSFSGSKPWWSLSRNTSVWSCHWMYTVYDVQILFEVYVCICLNFELNIWSVSVYNMIDIRYSPITSQVCLYGYQDMVGILCIHPLYMSAYMLYWPIILCAGLPGHGWWRRLHCGSHMAICVQHHAESMA